MKVNSDVTEDLQLLSNNIDIYKFGISALLLFLFLMWPSVRRFRLFFIAVFCNIKILNYSNIKEK